MNTPYETLILREVGQRRPEVPIDVFVPRSENWMQLDVVAYFGVQRARRARARALHVHPIQLATAVVDAVRAEGVEVHAWDVNDKASLQPTASLAIPRICTDQPREAQSFRQHLT